MATGSFKGDPFTGLGTWTYEDGTESQGYLEDFTGGRFGVGLAGLYDLHEGSRLFSLGKQGDFSFVEYGGNKYQVVSENTIRSANAPTGRHTEISPTGEEVSVPNEFIRMVSGTVLVNSVDNTVREFVIPQIPIAGVGAQWVAYDAENNQVNYETVRGNFNSTAEVQQVYGAGIRLATGREAIRGAVMKQIITQNEELLRQYIEENDIHGDTDHTRESAAVRLIFDMGNFSNIRTFTSALFE
jgi:hypothetical protein